MYVDWMPQKDQDTGKIQSKSPVGVIIDYIAVCRNSYVILDWCFFIQTENDRDSANHLTSANHVTS